MAGLRVLQVSSAIWRSYGTDGLVQRALYEWRKRGARYRRSPGAVEARVRDAAAPAAWPFAVHAERIAASTDRHEGLTRAQRVLAGEHQAYRWTWTALPRTPLEWRTHPVSGYQYSADVEWYKIGHYLRDAGDVKDMWEPARFGWVYDLIRGWCLTGDDAYAAAFWAHLDNFIDGNPPFLGVQWSCGQETSIRIMACLWAESAFHDAPSTTPERLARLRQMLVWSAERVDDAIGYALSQRNNHGISEAMGLVAIGVRFHDVESRAPRWLKRGHALLDRQVLDQFGEDGWFIQHSFNYMRLALEHLVLSQRMLESRGLSLGPKQRARIIAAGQLLAEVMTTENGRVPNHGANDGAYVLPITTANYLDFRPVLTGVAATFGFPIPADITPSSEVLAWLDAKVAGTSARATTSVRSGSSGWVVARANKVMVFARAGRYRSRPSHIDPLHVDVWFDGRPVATDAGTFRYWAEPPWANGLVDEGVHNTVTIADMPLAERGPRYLWLRWPAARVLKAIVGAGKVIRIELENESWAGKGIVHRRTCEVQENQVLVVDVLETAPSRNPRVTIRWLIDGDPLVVNVTASGPIAVESTIAHPKAVAGWISEGYASKRPGTSVKATASFKDGHLRLQSVFDLSSR